MIIRRLLQSSSQVGSTHAEDLIRSIGCTDLIADTRAERDERREERDLVSETIGFTGVLISNSRSGSPRNRDDFSLVIEKPVAFFQQSVIDVRNYISVVFLSSYRFTIIKISIYKQVK